MNQGSEQWLDWRRAGIGASDAPIIMQMSPYKTPYQLWLEKTGKVKPDEDKNRFIQDKGHRLEPIARAEYELMTGMSMPPALFESTTYPWMRASLDGFNGDTVLEIKYVGKEDYENAKLGKVPEKYFAQLQHQLVVTGAKRVHLFCFNETRGHNVEVTADIEFCKKLVLAEKAFWDLVVAVKAPELTDKDYKTIRCTELSKLGCEFNDAHMHHRQAEIRLEAIKKKILEHPKVVENQEHPRLKCDWMKIVKVDRAGNIDYAKIPELKGVELEKYRKKSSSYFKISFDDVE